MDSSFSLKDALTFIVYEAKPNKAVLAQAESAREYKLQTRLAVDRVKP